MLSQLLKLAVLTSATLPTIAGTPLKAMEFKYVSSGGNLAGSEWISAEGEITNSSASEFEQFLIRERLTQHTFFTVELDSPGGSLFGGLELGKKIREHKFSTSVGKSVISYQSGQTVNYSSKPGTCMSSCAFAFLGGVSRRAKPGEIGIHQFYQDYAISNPNIKLFDAKDLQSQQEISGLLVSYTNFMGVDPSFISTASLTPPNKIYFLNSNDLVTMRINVEKDQFDPWKIKATSSSIFLTSKTPDENKEAYITCGEDRSVRLSVFNKDFLSQGRSFNDIRSAVNSLYGIEIFWTKLPKQVVKAIILNKLAGVEITLPNNFPAMIRPKNGYAGMSGEIDRSRWWMFEYKLSYENLQNGLSAIYRACGN